MKKAIKILAIILAGLILIGVAVLFLFTRGLSEGREIQIEEVSLAELEDGLYRGQYKGGRWNSEVEVTVKGHQIIAIKLLSDPMIHPGQEDFSKILFERIIFRQTPNVEVISGATVTSKAYLKSVEKALKK